MNSKAAVLCWLSTWLSFRTAKTPKSLSPRRGLIGCPPDEGWIPFRASNRLGTYPAQVQYSFYVPPHGTFKFIISIRKNRRKDNVALTHHPSWLKEERPRFRPVRINTPPRPQTKPCWCRWTRSPGTTASCFDMVCCLMVTHSKVRQRCICFAKHP